MVHHMSRRLRLFFMLTHFKLGCWKSKTLLNCYLFHNHVHQTRTKQECLLYFWRLTIGYPSNEISRKYIPLNFYDALSKWINHIVIKMMKCNWLEFLIFIHFEDRLSVPKWLCIQIFMHMHRCMWLKRM